MSLRFPLLFAAVPLWAIDYEHPRKDRDFQRCLFSDGGIASNFPMHLFDGLVPQWPTFGIDLEPAIKGLSGRTFLPQRYVEGIADRWSRFDQAEKSASRLGGFLAGIANAMQNWNDNTQARLAGVRDRVVRVRLEKNRGGLNLDMPADVISDVAGRGAEAADKLVARFLSASPAPAWGGWSSQPLRPGRGSTAHRGRGDSFAGPRVSGRRKKKNVAPSRRAHRAGYASTERICI